VKATIRIGVALLGVWASAGETLAPPRNDWSEGGFSRFSGTNLVVVKQVSEGGAHSWNVLPWVTATIAVMVGCVTVQQYLVGLETLRLDLFEKRLAVYTATQQFLVESLRPSISDGTRGCDSGCDSDLASLAQRQSSGFVKAIITPSGDMPERQRIMRATNPMATQFAFHAHARLLCKPTMTAARKTACPRIKAAPSQNPIVAPRSAAECGDAKKSGENS
jgi:hypothetical protein